MTPLMIPLIVSIILFTMGTIGVLTRRDLLRVLLCVSIMLASVTLLIATLAQANPGGAPVLILFIWAVEIAEIIIAITLFVCLSRSGHSHLNDLRNLKW